MSSRILVEQTLATLAEFLAVEETALESMLTQRVVVTRGETFTKQLSLDDANLTRDAIVKSLYEVRTPFYAVGTMVEVTYIHHIVSYRIVGISLLNQLFFVPHTTYLDVVFGGIAVLPHVHVACHCRPPRQHLCL